MAKWLVKLGEWKRREERRREETRGVCQWTAAPVIYIDEGTGMAGSFQQFDHSGRVGS